MSMETDTSSFPPRSRGADVLALGFGTTVALWSIGYIARMPAVMLDSGLIAGLMLACLIAGGWLTGRLTERGWRGGMWVGLVIGSLNLLIFGSLREEWSGDSPSALLWLPGTIVAIVLVTALAAATGQWFSNFRSEIGNRKSEIGNPNWSFRFALVAVAATALLLLAGGLVTGREAGLAVPDWPASYGYNMFLYPLARMTGNIYYEHTHRLVGALVGLTTVVLAIHLWMSDTRKWLKWVAFAAVFAVVAQGVMGGYRVALADGSGTQVAQPGNETTASTVLRVAHGVFGQVFFALMVSLAVFTSTAWKAAKPLGADASMDRAMSALLVAVLMTQLILGALLRHLDIGLLLHLTVATMAFLLALVVGMRTLGVWPQESYTAQRRLAVGLLVAVTMQVILGITALVFRGSQEPGLPPTVADVTATSAHQLGGAALLALATALMLMIHRCSTPLRETDTNDPSMMPVSEAQQP